MGLVRRHRLERETAIGVGVTALAVAAMAVDHLLGDDPGLEDPLAFALTAGLSILVALPLFGWLVPRARGAGAPAATSALACSLLALLTFPFSLWLGFPIVLGGGGIALGLVGRKGRARAVAAIVLGGLVVAVATGAYAYVAVTKLF